MLPIFHSLTSLMLKPNTRRRRPFRCTLAVPAQVLESRHLLSGFGGAVSVTAASISNAPSTDSASSSRSIAAIAVSTTVSTFDASTYLRQAQRMGINIKLPQGVSFGQKTGHALKQIDTTFPVHNDATLYNYARVAKGYSLSFGATSVSDVAGALTVIIDGTSDQTPFVFAKVDGVLAVGFDLGGNIPFTPAVSAESNTPLTGNFYIAGAITIPDLPLAFSGEAVFDLSGKFLDELKSATADLSQIAEGKYKMNEYLSSQSSIDLNGSLSLSPELLKGSRGKSPINVDVNLANATLMLQNKTVWSTTLSIAGEATNSLFPHNPVTDAWLKQAGGAQVKAAFCVSASSKIKNVNDLMLNVQFKLQATLKNFLPPAANQIVNSQADFLLTNSGFTVDLTVGFHENWRVTIYGAGISGSLDGSLRGILTIGATTVSGTMFGSWRDSITKNRFSLSGSFRLSGNQYKLHVVTPDVRVLHRFPLIGRIGVTVRIPDFYIVL